MSKAKYRTSLVLRISGRTGFAHFTCNIAKSHGNTIDASIFLQADKELQMANTGGTEFMAEKPCPMMSGIFH